MKKKKGKEVKRDVYNPDSPLTRSRITFASIDDALEGLQGIDWGEPAKSSTEYSAKRLAEETRSVLFGARGRMREIIEKLSKKT